MSLHFRCLCSLHRSIDLDFADKKRERERVRFPLFDIVEPHLFKLNPEINPKLGCSSSHTWIDKHILIGCYRDYIPTSGGCTTVVLLYEPRKGFGTSCNQLGVPTSQPKYGVFDKPSYAPGLIVLHINQ